MDFQGMAREKRSSKVFYLQDSKAMEGSRSRSHTPETHMPMCLWRHQGHRNPICERLEMLTDSMISLFSGFQTMGFPLQKISTNASSELRAEGRLEFSDSRNADFLGTQEHEVLWLPGIIGLNHWCLAEKVKPHPHCSGTCWMLLILGLPVLH